LAGAGAAASSFLPQATKTAAATTPKAIVRTKPRFIKSVMCDTPMKKGKQDDYHPIP
jgi:hypothetical protein